MRPVRIGCREAALHRQWPHAAAAFPDVFQALHSASTEEILADLLVGKLAEAELKTAEERNAKGRLPLRPANGQIVSARQSAPNSCRLPAPGGVPGFVDELRTLKRKYKSLGYFQSNKLYYVFKLVSTTAIALASIWTVVNHGNNTLAVFGAGLLLALFWQQSGACSCP
jgi:hypothetical protein